MSKPKLHELLAVEGDLQGAASKIMDETKDTFTKRADHFTGFHKTLHMLDSAREQEAAAGEEHKELVSTVDEKLNYTSKAVIKYFDALLQKEKTNQNAKADLVVDGVTLATDLPATFLLGLEARLKLVRDYYAAIPTLQPGIQWVPDSTQRPGVYRASTQDVRTKTEKTVKAKVLYDATDKHPAQIDKWTEDIVIGLFKTDKWSGMLSPAQKSELLGRIDSLIQGVKKARQRANHAEVESTHVGKALFDFINGVTK